ncbi:MAG: response regulator transcription factor [Acidimicrobiia bacterium]|nr:response regulator transcription factor [Acidimicrobiia bacterium]
MRVLLVEDDDAIAAPLATGLEREGYEVTRVRTGADAVAATRVDLYLLDLGLPDIDGRDVCREIRGRSTVPIIVITARGDEVDRVVGLELGADDYLVKPFGFRELVARMRAVARRSAPAADPIDAVIAVDGVRIDPRTRQVLVDGAEVTLTRKEYDLLLVLAEDPGAVVTRAQILEQVWDPHWYGPSKTLDVHVASLRKKLGDPEVIETIRGVGYRLRTT